MSDRRKALPGTFAWCVGGLRLRLVTEDELLAALAQSQEAQPEPAEARSMLRLFDELIESIEVVDGAACWDYGRMYDLRNAIAQPHEDEEAELERATIRAMMGPQAAQTADTLERDLLRSDFQRERDAMRQALELIAAPKRPDGTWNRDREACRQLALDALGATQSGQASRKAR
jgi:hypothetical protein